MNRIIGIDPGATCGMVVVDGGKITSAFNIISEEVATKCSDFLIHNHCIVVIEDLRPYSLRVTQQVIDTCKFIGELNFRLKTWSGANVEYVTRFQIKKWCFDQFPEVCIPIIERKIERKGYKSGETGEFRKPSFVFVDDKIVTKCMKFLHQIKDPKPGSGYDFGLKDHSWQALAVASYWGATRAEN